MSKNETKPKYPIYIISKGRWESRLTSKSLEWMDVDYKIVIEPQEYEQYSKEITKDKILVLPFSNLGQGSIPARNWVWEHSISIGAKRHWILDDNIRWFYRVHNNKKIRVKSGSVFRAAEDFVDRYTNVPMSGFQYHTFCYKRTKYTPFVLNTRVYSCILLENKMPQRWRGRYNEDTDLSLQFLKAGYCTILFYSFLCGKVATMTMSGGNTDKLYEQTKQFDGRLEMAKHLQRQHPDVTQIKQRWGRWQHVVDYKPFKNNKLKRKNGLVLEKKPNNYGLKLERAE